jgi:uncharacterized protein YdaU (DUF1376 family)
MKSPAVLLYTSDFLTGITFFTDEQIGQYILLLCQQHQLGHLPKEHMIKICKSFDSPVIKKFITDENGNYYNVRMESEINRRNEYSKTRSDNRKGKVKTNKKHIKNISKTYLNDMENENDNENIDVIDEKGKKVDFEIFWNLYDKKVGDKIKIEKKWNELNLEVQKQILEYIPKYKNSQPDKKFRKDPSTFFNNKGWNDEIIYSSIKNAPSYDIKHPNEQWAERSKQTSEDRKNNPKYQAELQEAREKGLID